MKKITKYELSPSLIEEFNSEINKHQEAVDNFNNMIDINNNKIEQANSKLNEHENRIDTIESVQNKEEESQSEYWFNIKDYGVKIDGETDSSVDIQNALDSLPEGSTLVFPEGEYLINNEIEITKPVSLLLSPKAKILFNSHRGSSTCFHFKGEKNNTIFAQKNASAFDKEIELSNTDGLKEGEWIQIVSDELAGREARDYDTKREFQKIEKIEGNKIILTSGLIFDYDINKNFAINTYNFLEDASITGGQIINISSVSSCFGIKFSYCYSFYINNVHSKEFTYACFDSNTSLFGRIVNNIAEISFRDTLQYGIVTHASSNLVIANNTINSARTGIDISRVSSFITVTGNISNQGGINTHSAMYVNISGNTMNNGGINIRGAKITVSNNNVYNKDSTCLQFQEMAMEGNIMINNNFFEGFMGCRFFTNNVTFINNIVNAYDYHASTQSIFRIRCLRDMEGKFVFKDNIIKYLGDKPAPTAIHNSELQIVKDFNISGNTVENFSTAFNFTCTTINDNSENLIITGNIIKSTEIGIRFRYIDSVMITNNLIEGIGKMDSCIERGHMNSGTEDIGLFIMSNILKNSNIGININGTGNSGSVGNSEEAGQYHSNGFVNIDNKISGSFRFKTE